MTNLRFYRTQCTPGAIGFRNSVNFFQSFDFNSVASTSAGAVSFYHTNVFGIYSRFFICTL